MRKRSQVPGPPFRVLAQTLKPEDCQFSCLRPSALVVSRELLTCPKKAVVTIRAQLASISMPQKETVCGLCEAKTGPRYTHL